MEKEQYVIYPHERNYVELTPQDKLIYLAIRRYMNEESMTAFPSYARITKDIGAAAKTIKKSVDRLINAGYLETFKKGRSIIYKFNNKNHFEPFSYKFLDNPNLTFTEKSYIVASQQYMYAKEGSEEGLLSFKNKELSKLINMSESTISRCNHSLQTKGYLEGAGNLVKRFQLRELDQLLIIKLREHEDKLQKHEDEITSLKKELEQLKAQLNKKDNKQVYIL